MKRKSLLISSFALALVLGFGVGCAKKTDDAKVTAEIQSKFSQDSGLSNKTLGVQADSGVVTLSGNVDNDAQREAAGRQAASVAGVKTVINNLQVGAVVAAAPPGEAPAQMANPPADEKPTPDVRKANRVDKKAKKARRSEDADANQNQSNDSSDQTAMDQPPPDMANQTPPTSPPPLETPPPPPPPKKLIIDQGTQLSIRLVDPIDSEKNQTGDTFHATLNAPLTSDGEEAVPAGVELVGHLADVKSAGKFAGQSAVVLQLDSMSSGGKTYNLQTDQYRKDGKSRGKNTAEKVGGGAIIGGIIGAIAGGGKGAGIGSAAGAGVGGGVQAATKGQQIKLPSETVLNFTLQAPITVIQAPSPDANRQKLGNSQ